MSSNRGVACLAYLWYNYRRCDYGSSRNKNSDHGTVGPGGKHPGLALT
jgi:hypothetical protein